MDKRFEYPKDEAKDREALAAQVRRDQYRTTWADPSERPEPATEQQHDGGQREDYGVLGGPRISLDTQPRGLARLDAAGLGQLRDVLFDVFDKRKWQISESDDVSFDLATEERWQLAEAITTEIVRRAAPATTATSAHDPDHLNPAKGGNRASDDYW